MNLQSPVIVSKSGDLNTVVAGTSTSHADLVLETRNSVLPGSISAAFTVDAETNTITVEARWEVSNDKSTWLDMPVQGNTAVTVLATGTAGADAAVTKVIPAPLAVHGWRYCRPVVVNRVVTGNSADTWAIDLHYRKVA